MTRVKGHIKENLGSMSSGFTLIELLVALAIFLIGILGAWNLYLSSIKANKFASDLVEATLLASDVIEAKKYEGQSSGSEFVDNYFRREWSISSINSSNDQITIVVGWGGNKNECSGNANKCKHKIQISAVVPK